MSKNQLPANELNPKKVITEFLEGEEKLLCYLERAQKLNIGKLRMSISISKFIKLKPGIPFVFLIAHQQRHMLQALKAYKVVKKESAVKV
ncbi:MAG: hypothetical protein ACM3H8_16265 [Sphingobacteriales bacterium]